MNVGFSKYLNEKLETSVKTIFERGVEYSNILFLLDVLDEITDTPNKDENC